MAETILPPDTAFRKVLDSHGYAFQYSIIRLAEQLYDENKSGWIFEVAEFPVSVQGKDTRIDLILRKRDTFTYIIGECKRVNPALGHWCFARAPYTHREPNDQKLLAECLDVVSLDKVKAIDPKRPYTLINSAKSARSLKIFHVGLELKSNEKGDKSGSTGRGAIEEAAGQVLRGVNGMIEHIASHQWSLRPGYRVCLVPVIFTTAQLWTSDVDLGAADLETGKLELDVVTLTAQPWLWLNYNQSPALKHSLGKPQQLEISDVLENEFTRSIAIVSALGVEDFLRRCEF